jgi:hypothetical protein
MQEQESRGQESRVKIREYDQRVTMGGKKQQGKSKIKRRTKDVKLKKGKAIWLYLSMILFIDKTKYV